MSFHAEVYVVCYLPMNTFSPSLIASTSHKSTLQNCMRCKDRKLCSGVLTPRKLRWDERITDIITQIEILRINTYILPA